jgi:hypothetical protein
MRVPRHFAEVRGPPEPEASLSGRTREHADALVIFPSAMLFAERGRIVALAVAESDAAMAARFGGPDTVCMPAQKIPRPERERAIADDVGVLGS